MADKKRYYKLDDIGFIGTQKKISPVQQKSDAIMTAKIIKAEKSGKFIPLTKTVHSKRKAV